MMRNITSFLLVVLLLLQLASPLKLIAPSKFIIKHIHELRKPQLKQAVYTVARVTYDGSKGVNTRVAGVDFHLDRLSTSYRALTPLVSMNSIHAALSETRAQLNDLCTNPPSYVLDAPTCSITLLWVPSPDNSTIEVRSHLYPATYGQGGSDLTTRPNPITAIMSAIEEGAEKISRFYEPGLALTKHASWVLTRKPLEKFKSAFSGITGHEVVMFDEKTGDVLEGMTTNVFGVVDGVLCTTGSSNVLHGYTRSAVLKLAKESKLPGIKGVRMNFTLDDILNSQAVFVTSAVGLVVGVSSINHGGYVAWSNDDRELVDGIADATREYMDSECVNINK
jgi:branched-subunit amino acid aminotransferase/4-amino-4-deoxychorismate lyase